MTPEFLTLDEVLTIHRDQIDRYGGSEGVRDMDLLMSALQQPQMGFGGEYFHPDIFTMAGAYLFHISRNHPFLDGNKRAAAAAAVVFLIMNGVHLRSDEAGLERITLAAAQGQIGKPEIAEFFRSIAQKA